MYRIESLLSARLFMSPRSYGDRLFFISNLSGRLSLYAMDFGGSVPEPLLPPHIALQNPHLIDGTSYYVFPKLNKILVMIDRDGDENYQPMLIPLQGDFPVPAFNNYFADYRVHLGECDPETNTIFLTAESRKEPVQEGYMGNLETGELVKLAASPYGASPSRITSNHDRVLIAEGYTMGDIVLSEWQKGQEGLRVLFGTLITDRQAGQVVPLNGIMGAAPSPSENGLVVGHALVSDTYSLGFLDLTAPQKLEPIEITGIQHTGQGEMDHLEHLQGEFYLVGYNIDGVSWLYEGQFDEAACRMELVNVLVGRGRLANGTLESISYNKTDDRFTLSFSTATSPTQIFTLEGKNRERIREHTCERILGIPDELLSAGEDASFTSFDGTRISARLYLPAETLGFKGPRPVVYYVHGGPQGQERPDFAWFSMPLIQYLTLNGFAVFVPNVRGSTGYGLSYTKQVDHDWGGKDRQDHVFAMEKVLPKDKRLDVKRAAVVGRSYGGYMTLTLAGRHPELWSAAADMFGPFSLLSFMERIPPTWKPYFLLSIGDPEKDKDFLVERSPSTHIDQITCPLLVIQGKHDPRVVEPESHDLVDHLRSEGKEVEYLMFENEGHDVLKFENRVACYNAITEFFKKYLKP